MIERAKWITESDGFAQGVAMLIVANAFALGLEQVDAVMREWDHVLFVFFWVSQALFVVEITLRFVAGGMAPRAFFADPWNRFDTAVVAASLLPVAGAFAPIARVFRVLRVLRVFSSVGALRELVEQRGVTGGAIVPLGVLTTVFWYVSAVVGAASFGEVDPERWGSLFHALRTVITLTVGSDVAAVMGPVTDAEPFALAYFGAFYVILAAMLLQVVAGAVREPHGEGT